jgi:hypothetical protein
MADVLFVVLTIAFFAVATLFVYACDRIIGADAVRAHEAAPVVDEDLAA